MDHSGRLTRQLDNVSASEAFSFFGTLQSFGTSLISTASNVMNSIVNTVKNCITGHKRTYEEFTNDFPVSANATPEISLNEDSIEEAPLDILDIIPVQESPLKKQKVQATQQENMTICNVPTFDNPVNDFEGLEPMNVEISMEMDNNMDEQYDFGVDQVQPEAEENKNARTFLPRAAKLPNARLNHCAKGYNANGLRSNIYKRK